MRSMTGEIQRSDEGDLTIWIGAQKSRWKYISWASRFNESKLDEDLTIVIQRKNLEVCRGATKLFYLRD